MAHKNVLHPPCNKYDKFMLQVERLLHAKS